MTLRYPPRTLSTNREGRLFLMGELSRLPPLLPVHSNESLKHVVKGHRFARKLAFLSVLHDNKNVGKMKRREIFRRRKNRIASYIRIFIKCDQVIPNVS